jgi:serine phosphatase RsbU (regulator of sigma subunit)
MEYSEPKLEQELCRIGVGDPRRIVTQLCETVAEFASGAAQSDDITVLALRFLATAGPSAKA